MKNSRRKLSIDTDHSLNIKSCTSLTATTCLNFPLSGERDSILGSFNSSKMSVDQINEKNRKICEAVLRRLDDQHKAVEKLEIEKLRMRVEKLENKLSSIQDQNKESVQKNACECSQKCPIGPSNSFYKLKFKLKEAKQEKKLLKLERDGINSELYKYKMLNKEIKRFNDHLRESPLNRSPSVNSCTVF